MRIYSQKYSDVDTYLVLRIYEYLYAEKHKMAFPFFIFLCAVCAPRSGAGLDGPNDLLYKVHSSTR